MRTDSIIVLSDYLPQEAAAAPAAAPQAWRVRRRCARLLAALEAAVTVAIGAGFLLCVGLAVCML